MPMNKAGTDVVEPLTEKIEEGTGMSTKNDLLTTTKEHFQAIYYVILLFFY
jgi:hypothetical protein